VLLYYILTRLAKRGDGWRAIAGSAQVSEHQDEDTARAAEMDDDDTIEKSKARGRR
jgi:hypothetical protein